MTVRREGYTLGLRTVPLAGYILAGTLAVLSAVSWVIVAQASMPMTGLFDLSALTLFTIIWAIGMVAMMLPSIIPMIYAIDRSKLVGQQPKGVGLRVISPALFLLGYVGIWTLVGIIFYLMMAFVAGLGYSIVLGGLGVAGGVVLIATGIYQFTRFKQSALMKCRTPLGFIMTGWKDGPLGAARMGGNYGLFCTKCCWVLMAGLLVVGAMSLPLMGVFAIIIFMEKIGPIGLLVSKLVGAAFILVGLLLVV